MAAANKVEVRKPKVKIKGEATDSITYDAKIPVSSSVDGCPSVRYSQHKSGGPKIESPTATDLIQKIAEAQKAMFQSPTQNSVVIEDGSGGGMVFQGYDTGPHHDIMFGGVSNGKSIVHRCARLLFINTSVYRPPPPEKGQKEPPTAEAIQTLAATNNPCEALKIVLEKIIKDFLSTSGKYADNRDFEIRKKVHADNEKILKEEWYPILEASTKSGISAWASAMESNSIRIKIYDTIRLIYLGGASDFSAIISQFESAFQMRFIPSTLGAVPGKFIPFSEVLDNPEPKEVNILTLSMNPGPRKFLSPTAVAIRGLPSTTPPPTAQAAQPAGSDLISWPDPPPEAGQTLFMQMPAWLPAKMFPKFIPKKNTSNLDFYANLSELQSSTKKVLTDCELVHKICSDIARLTYNDVSLQSASATIVCPLDVTWELGKRYSIKQPNSSSEGSSDLFSGFLRGIQHRVNSSTSKAEASTQLTFSHVEANGFTLPNK